MGNLLVRSTATIAGGQSKTVKIKLSRHGRSAVSRGRKVRVQVLTLDDAGDTLQIKRVKLAGKKHGKKHKQKHR
jgi:hypothetical protein